MSDTYTDPVILASAGMGSDYSDVRMEAARRMGQTDLMQCARYLFSMALYDASLEVRTTAANALEYMDHDAVAAGLDFEARTPDAEHRVAAIKLLGRRRDSGSIKTLSRVLTAREQTVRQAALRALEQIGGEVAAMAICEAPIPAHLEVDERQRVRREQRR